MEGKLLPSEATASDAHTSDFEGVTIDVYKLIKIAESLSPTLVPLSNFEALKTDKFWHDSNGNWLGPEDIISLCKNNKNPHQLIDDESIDFKLREHLQKVLDADYHMYPIISIRGTVVDGIHRLTRAFIDGAENIQVRDFARLPEGVVTE